MKTPSRDDVARRAYELFQARGNEPGHDLEHWLEAERELSRTAEDEGTGSRVELDAIESAELPPAEATSHHARRDVHG
jgi:hypothetical protein